MVLQCRWSRLTSCVLPRSSHTVTALAGRTCIFGGEDAPRNAFDNCLHFLAPDGSWASSTPMPGPPVLGQGAAAVNDQLFIFGGREGGANTFAGQGTSGESARLVVFNVESACWEDWSPSPVGTPWPEPRSFLAMCSSGGLVYVFGGCGESGRLNDLWRLDPLKREWQCVHKGGTEAPLPRGGSTLVADDGNSRLVLLFGFSGQQQGDIATFDLQTGCWEVLQQAAQTGDVPAPRSVIAAAASLGATPGRVVVFGGEHEASDLGHAGAGVFAADLHVLDLASLRWTRLEAVTDTPEPRGWSGLAACSENKFILFGGLNSANERLGDAWEVEIPS